MISGIIAAAGLGRRMGASENKVFLKILDKTILEYTVDAFLLCSDIDEIVIVTGINDIERCRKLFKSANKPIVFVCGGNTRQQSVYNGIIASKGNIVVIHDGARALITPHLISNAINACKKHGAAALGVTAKDTVKIIDKNGFVEKTLERSNTYQIQTPQVFDRELIKNAHEQGKNISVTDDCSLAESMHIPIKIVDGSYENIKITTPVDMLTAAAILKQRNLLK